MGEKDASSTSHSNRDSGHRKSHASRHHKRHQISSSDVDEHRSKKRRSRDSEKKGTQRVVEKQLLSDIKPISREDYFRLSSEFRIWLHEHKKIFFDELKSDETHKYFESFVRRWNTGKLESTPLFTGNHHISDSILSELPVKPKKSYMFIAEKYYEGIPSSQVDPAGLTKYKWNFKGKGESAEKLELIRNQIDRATNKDFAMEVKIIVNAQHHTHIGDQHKHRAPQGPTMPPPAGSVGALGRHGGDEGMDDENKARYNHFKRKKEEKLHKKTREADLEELVPKATGRDAILDKRRTQTAYHRSERDDGMEVPESVLMGGDDYQVRLAVQRTRDERMKQRAEQKREEMSVKVESYNNKEAATISMLRQLAEASRAAGAGLSGLNARK